MSVELECERQRRKPKKNTEWKLHKQLRKIITKRERGDHVGSTLFRRADELIKQNNGMIPDILDSQWEKVKIIRKELGK